MQEDKAAQAIWKSQAEEQNAGTKIEMTADELCAMARGREKLNAFLMSAMLVATIGIMAALLYNVYRVDQPWVRLGQAWTLAMVVYMAAPGLRRGQWRIGASEPCARFLIRQHEERRAGYLWIRRRLFLLIPGIAACWWGGGPRGWLLIITVVALVLVWLAFGEAAEKATRDGDQIRRAIT